MSVRNTVLAALRAWAARLEMAPEVPGQLLAAYRAEVLREEATRLRRVEREMPHGAHGTRMGVLKAALVLDEDADTAEEKTTATAAAVTPQPTSVALRVEDARDLTTLAPARTAEIEISGTTIHLDLTATREQWAAWMTALSVDLARTTNRGSSATSHATWRGVHVAIRCYLIDTRKDGRS